MKNSTNTLIPKHLYLISHRLEFIELCALEMKSIFGKTSNSNYHLTDELIDILNEIGKYNDNELTEDEKDYIDFILDESSESQKALINSTNPNCSNIANNIIIDKRFMKFYNGSFVDHYNQFSQKYKSQNLSEIPFLPVRLFKEFDFDITCILGDRYEKDQSWIYSKNQEPR